MGLAGAAATNGGLALLGGGSLAAGGLGMAGGTAVVAAGVGAVGAAAGGVGAAAVRLGSPEEEVAECAKLLVLVPDVIIGIERDMDTARLAADRLRQRMREADDQRDATGAPNPRRRYPDTVLPATARTFRPASSSR